MPKGVRNNPIIEPTEFDCAYAAGFIDGEGAISVRARKPMLMENGELGNPSWYASLTVSQIDPAPLQWLADRWGGTVRVMAPPGKPTWSQGYEWCVVARQFYRCMDSVRPYLTTKFRQADNALRLRELPQRRGVLLTQEGILIRQEIQATGRRLNERGKGVVT